jgi:hypothetical protein
MSRRRRILLSLCAAVALFGGWVVWLRYEDAQSRLFDAERWRGAAGGTKIRSRMAGDLVAGNRLRGMSRAAVLALLGPAQREIRNADDWSLRYNLGLPDLGIDDDILDISLDPHGIVTRSRVYSS